MQRFLRIYDTRLLRHTRLYDGVDDLLDTLAARAPLALLTNKPIGATHAVLEGLGVSRFFTSRVLGGDGPHPRKPDATGLLQLIAAAGVDAGSTMMVGDSVIDLRTGRAAGTRVCLAQYRVRSSRDRV
ncbi:MAG: HAD-IA family hydrolase [Vicinamibacterales bacterium]